MKGKKKNVRAADVKSRLLSDEGPSPFSSIVLKEKKEEPKKTPNKIELSKKKPGEIVQGYDRNADFADILFAYEHTGSPYALPSQKRQQEIRDNKKTDFGAILDKWEGKNAPKKTETPMKKSQNKVNKSFADIFAEYEASAPKKELKKEMAEKGERKAPPANPFFVSESEDDERSSSAVWSIYGSNKPVERAPKKVEATAKPIPVEIKKSEKYVPQKDFGEILSLYAGEKKKSVPPAPPSEKKVEKKEEDIKPCSLNPFFLEEGEEDTRSTSAAWSIYGNNNSFKREEKKAEEKAAPAPVEIKKSGKYVPKKDFGTILGEYASSAIGRKQAQQLKTEDKAESREDDNPFFLKEEGDATRSSSAVWSIFGSNENVKRPEAVKSENQKPEIEIVKSAKYVPEQDFSSILDKYGESESFDEIMKKKGIAESETKKLTISELRAMLPEATLDLHGFTEAEAIEELKKFLSDAEKEKLRKISVIHGKGLHSENGVGVLKAAVERVLNESGAVSESFTPKAQYGGSGALWIILKEN